MPVPLKPQNSTPDPTSIARRAQELRGLLHGADPLLLAARTGCVFVEDQPGEGAFEVAFWGQPVRLSYPEFTARDSRTAADLPPFIQAMLLYYFNTADGTPLTGRWISFADLPDGRFYNQAFQGYTGAELQRHFKNDPEALRQASLRASGSLIKGSPGDYAFYFQALPRFPLLLVIWEGDEDFPPSFQLLFDAAAAHYLPTDACAILGSSLTSRLKK